MNFVQQMMKQSAIVSAYYKSYYLAKGWLELGLTALQTRGPWFDYMVNTWDAIIQDNFFSGYNYSLSLSISWTASLLTPRFWQGSGCDDPYLLTGGDSIIVPLFRDVTEETFWSLFTTGIAYQNLADLLSENIDFLPSGTNGDVIYWILILSGEDLSQNGIFFKTGTLQWGLHYFMQAFDTYIKTVNDFDLYGNESYLYSRYQNQELTNNGFRMYFMISNRSDDVESFCIDIVESDSVLPTDSFLLQSQAVYANQQVVLDASYAQPIPGFLFSTYVSF